MKEQNKFYWLKLKRDFFKRHDIQIIESMPNGKDYVLFYLKLICESIDHEGSLRFSDTVPYNEHMLSAITNTNIDVVRSALKLLRELNLIEILDDQTIYMNEVSKLIGSAVDNDNANRQRRFRDRKKEQLSASRYESVTKSNESIEIEKEIDNTTTTTNTTYTACARKVEKREKVDYLLVADYFIRRRYISSPTNFHTYNESRGWVGVGGEDVAENWQHYADMWELQERRKYGEEITLDEI